MLSPAESIGLSGTTLDNRVREAVHRVGDGALARIADRLKTDALTNAVVYERDGVEEAVRIMLRPLLVMPEQLSYVENVCLKLSEALKRLPGLYLQDEQVPAFRWTRSFVISNESTASNDERLKVR
jgi:hypothetical protein